MRDAACRLALGLLCIVMSAPAAAQVPTRSASIRPCIDSLSTASWTAYDAQTVLVRSGGRAFRITTRRCPGLSRLMPQISTVIRGGSSICSPQDVELYVSEQPGPSSIRCFIDRIDPLTPAQLEALEAARRHHGKGG